MDAYQIISTKLIDLRDKEAERNPKLVKSKFEEVKLFGDSNPRSVKIRKILPTNFKERFI